jgi:hypothetical protein
MLGLPGNIASLRQESECVIFDSSLATDLPRSRRHPMRFVTRVAVISLLMNGLAQADGRCDLNGLVGYQILFAKPIEGYIEGGVRKKGYEGCEADRVLVFSDNTGVRCKELVRQHEDLPTGYLFARNNLGDLKLCVDGELFDVSQTN